MPTWSELTGTWAEQVGTWEGGGSVFTSTLIFQPPIRGELARVTPEMNESERMFWSHIRRGPVGVNVFKLIDGSYTESQPWDDTQIAITYLGGHIYEVDQTEGAALTAAGYTVIGTVEPPEPPVEGDVDTWDDLVGIDWNDLIGRTWSDL